VGRSNVNVEICCFRQLHIMFSLDFFNSFKCRDGGRPVARSKRPRAEQTTAGEHQNDCEEARGKSDSFINAIIMYSSLAICIKSREYMFIII